MLKILPLAVVGLALALPLRAQTLTDQVRLPGQPAENSPRAAARAGAVSQLQETLLQNWSGGWVNYSRYVYLRYRTPTLPGLVRTDRANGANWVPYIAHRYQYTTAGEIQSDTTDQFQTAPYGAYTASVGAFDAPNRLRHDWQTFNLPGSTAPWDSLTRNTYAYNAAGQRTQTVTDHYFQDKFQTRERTVATYNALGQVAVLERQSAPAAAGAAWEPLQRQTFVYNAAGRVQQAVTEVAIGMPTYSNYFRSTQEFDAQGREAVLTVDSWGDDKWERYSQTLYAYGPTDDLASATFLRWDSGAYQNAQRLLFAYAQVLGTRPAAGLRRLSVAPNPSAAAAPAKLLLEPGAAGATGAVYDQLGRAVAVLSCSAAQAARGSLPLPAGLPAGLYVVRLQAGPRQWQARWNKQ